MNIIDKIKLPILITRSAVAFPKTELQLTCMRDFSVLSIDTATKKYNNLIFVTSQINPEKETITDINDIYTVGTLCEIGYSMNRNKVLKVTVHGLERYTFNNLTFEDGVFFVEGEVLPDEHSEMSDNDIYIITNKIIDLLNGGDSNSENVTTFLNTNFTDFKEKLKSGFSANEFAYWLASKLNVETSVKEKILTCLKLEDRFQEIYNQLNIILLRKDIDAKIENNMKEALNKANKEYYLRSQIQAIKKELGEGGENSEQKYLEKLKKGNYPKEVEEKVKEELNRLSNMPQGTLEYSLILDYLDILFELPFNKFSEDNDSLERARKILDDDHYGLDKAKDRIIEYLAVKKINKNLKAPVICFYGPPGTGKTSLAMSIAKSLGREFIKCSLGGISDEAEIRGHRRTYVGSKPGRIMSFMKKCGTSNPVFCLDEIDKLSGNGVKGDPAAALLEVLDPEQNTHFRDNYLEVEYDLSNVLFICTCNYLEDVPEPLRDRLELIPIESYTVLEKEKIAEHHLVKKECLNNGLDATKIKFSKEAIDLIIEKYTREAGVRELSRKIGTILRKVIVEKIEKDGLSTTTKIGVKDVKKYLGTELFSNTDKEKKEQVGVVTGLAYTQYGGDILPIEVNHFEGNGKLILTGNLGEIMKESCSIALDYVKANSKKYNIDLETLNKSDVHIHVPEGAVPKDGPSAGIAITTAIISALTDKPVSNDVAMTGEVNLRGNALPIGGLREKSLAALRSGIKTIIVPKGNKKNITELPKEITDNLNVIYMDSVDDALKVSMR